jgi:putative peptide zinc metalloprotease protein
VFAVTAGHVNPGPGAKERRQNELMTQVRTRFEGSRRIVVMSRKGGVGKTTTTLMLGHTFATHRGDRVVAVDANPDAGNLATRIQRETTNGTTDLLVNRAWVQRYAQIRSYSSQHPGSRLEVIASDDDAGISLALGKQDYRDLIDTVDRFYNLILVDTGTGILDDANQGILQEADQLVLVMPPALDGGRVAAMTLDWLDHHGYQEHVWRAVAVINGVRSTPTEQLDRLVNHLRWRCASTLSIPWDPTLDGGAQTSLGDLAPATRQAYLELAGAVASQFGEPGRPLFE